MVKFWQGLPKSRQPKQCQPGQGKSYECLCEAHCVSLHSKLTFLEVIANERNGFLKVFQSNGSFFVCAFEHILRNSCLKFIRKDALKEAKALLKLMFLPKLICLPNKTNLF